MTLLPPSSGLEKIGRMAWIVWLCLAGPRVWLCAILAVSGVSLLWVGDWGSVEEPPVPDWEPVLIWASLASGAPLWLGGVLFAHHFNRGLWALLPFLGNLPPLLGIMWLVLPLADADGGEFGVIAVSLGLEALVLGIGTLSALLEGMAAVARRVRKA